MNKWKIISKINSLYNFVTQFCTVLDPHNCFIANFIIYILFVFVLDPHVCPNCRNIWYFSYELRNIRETACSLLWGIDLNVEHYAANLSDVMLPVRKELFRYTDWMQEVESRT